MSNSKKHVLRELTGGRPASARPRHTPGRGGADGMVAGDGRMWERLIPYKLPSNLITSLVNSACPTAMSSAMSANATACSELDSYDLAH